MREKSAGGREEQLKKINQKWERKKEKKKKGKIKQHKLTKL